MKKAILTLASLLFVFAASAVSTPSADAAVHEIVAAYCSGGGVGVIDNNGFLEPPGINGGSNANNFAQPVRSNGAVVGTPPNLVIGSSPAAKYAPGTNVFTGLNTSTATNPSAAHCPRNALPSP